MKKTNPSIPKKTGKAPTNYYTNKGKAKNKVKSLLSSQITTTVHRKRTREANERPRYFHDPTFVSSQFILRAHPSHVD